MNSDQNNFKQNILDDNVQNKENDNINVNIQNNPMVQVSNSASVMNVKSNNSSPPTKKKNRTLQYYKFLFYSIKGEIKLYEFFTLVSWTNHIELVLFVIGLIIFFALDKKSPFAIIDILHAARGIIGYCFINSMPTSYQILDKMELTSEEIENETFNDLMRKQMKIQFFDKVKNNSTMIITYFSITIVNVFIDTVDFLIALSNLNNESDVQKLVAYHRLIISALYLSKYPIKIIFLSG